MSNVNLTRLELLQIKFALEEEINIADQIMKTETNENVLFVVRRRQKSDKELLEKIKEYYDECI